jgi:hypothetical protein
LIDRAGLLDDDPGIAADLDALRGVLELRTGVPADAHAFLVSAARHIADEDPVRAIELLTDAGQAASYAGDIDLVVATGRQTAQLIPRVPVAATLPALVLVGARKVVSGEAESGRADCRRAADLAASTTDPQQLTFGAIGAQYAGDEALQHALAARAVDSARSRGAVAMLPYALEFLGLSELSANRLTAARAVATEGLTLARELRQENSIGRHLAILAWIDAVQGRETPCREQSAEALSVAARRVWGCRRRSRTGHWGSWNSCWEGPTRPSPGCPGCGPDPGRATRASRSRPPSTWWKQRSAAANRSTPPRRSRCSTGSPAPSEN